MSGFETLVDNGNFQTLGVVRSSLAAQAKALAKRVASLERTLGRSARLKDIETPLRGEFKKLSRQAEDSVAASTLTPQALIDRQRTLSPSRLVGAEDIVPAVRLALDVESRFVGSDTTDLRKRNARVAKRALRDIDNLPSALARQYFPVASASSYNSAHDAGRIFAGAGLRRIAMGFGAFMADNNFIDHYRIGRQTTFLDGRLPNRYLRTVLVARGFFDGYRQVMRGAPLAFHFLGLGAPIMMPLVSLAAWGTRELTFDATSPIKDAVRGVTLYVSKPAYLKVRTRKVATRIGNGAVRWDCPCPYCMRFLKTRPFKYSKAKRLWSRSGRDRVSAKDLTEGGLLFDSVPLLSEPRGGPLRRDVNQARIGHNHWALFEVLRELREAGTRRSQIARHVHSIIDAYAANALPHFARALRVAEQLTFGELR